MTVPSRPSSLRIYASLMIGVGLIAIGVMLFMLLNNAAASTDDPAAGDLSLAPLQVDYAAPELALTDLSGKAVSLKDHLGSVVLVNLWATWCPPCKEELPSLQAYYEKYKANGFVLVGIDQEETLDIVQPFVTEYRLTYPIWLDEHYLAERVFKTSSLPTSFVIDRGGTVRLTWVGGVDKKFLEKYVTKIIKE